MNLLLQDDHSENSKFLIHLFLKHNFLPINFKMTRLKIRPIISTEILIELEMIFLSLLTKIFGEHEGVSLIILAI